MQRAARGGVGWGIFEARLGVDRAPRRWQILRRGARGACRTPHRDRSHTTPVEGDQGGPGTLFGHWDEATFFNELMTGFLNSSASANPLSDLSAASMGDLGYVVNLGSGDRYRLPRATAAVVAPETAASVRPGLDLKGRERLIKPVAVVR